MIWFQDVLGELDVLIVLVRGMLSTEFGIPEDDWMWFLER